MLECKVLILGILSLDPWMRGSHAKLKEWLDVTLLGHLKPDQRHSQVGAGPLLKKVQVPLRLLEMLKSSSSNLSPRLAGQKYPEAKNPSARQKQSAGFKAQMTDFFFNLSF